MEKKGNFTWTFLPTIRAYDEKPLYLYSTTVILLIGVITTKIWCTDTRSAAAAHRSSDVVVPIIRVGSRRGKTTEQTRYPSYPRSFLTQPNATRTRRRRPRSRCSTVWLDAVQSPSPPPKQSTPARYRDCCFPAVVIIIVRTDDAETAVVHFSPARPVFIAPAIKYIKTKI